MFKAKTSWMIVLLAFLLMSCKAADDKTAAQASPQAVPVQKPALPIDAYYDDIAALLAGYKASSPDFASIQDSQFWKIFEQSINTAWVDIDLNRLQKMRKWIETEIKDVNADTKILFYPFGGPDFLTAFELFPDADTYILMGLELVGNMPGLDKRTPQENRGYFANLSESMSDFFQKSYFITNHMIEKLQADKVDGVLPLLCFFLKRSGQNISSITRIEWDDAGNRTETPYQPVRRKIRRPDGIRIVFTVKGSDRPRILEYYSCDLADAKFNNKSKFYTDMNGLGAVTTFLKSASYIMQDWTFSNIRSMILANSRYILQDDTGVPFRMFQDGKWDITLFGQYAKPIKDFANMEQKELREAYADKSKIRPLTFHLGYHWGSNLDALFLAKKKTDQP